MKHTLIIFFLLLISLFSPTTYGWMDMPWVLWFYIASALYILVYSIINYKKCKGYGFADYCIGFYFFYIILSQFFHGGLQALQNEHFITVVLMVLLYNLFKNAIVRLNLFLFFRLITFSTLLLLLHACTQWAYAIRNELTIVQHVKFLFFNSGIFAIYIATILPVHLYLFQLDKKIVKIISLISILLSVILILAVQSRVAILISLLPLSLLLLKKLNTGSKPLMVKKSIVFFFLFSIAISTLYFYKVNSSNGRLLIWKISLTNATDNVVGIGVGNFAYKYPLWQAAYFSNKGNISWGAYLADMSFYAFNEWLQLLIEGGILSLLLFAGFLWFTLRNGYKSRDSKETSVFILILSGIIIGSFVSYPLHNPTIFFLLILSCAYINSSKIDDFKTFVYFLWGQKILSVFRVSITIFLLGYFISQYIALGYWRNAKQNIIANETKALQQYKNAYPLLRHKGEFLFNYGAQYFEMGIYDKSLKLFDEAETLFSHYSLFIYKGANYQKLKQYQEAEKYFLTAENMIPSRIYPKSLLAKLYAEKGDSVKAFQMARIVVNFKNKVDGAAVDSIKNEMKILLEYEK